MEDLAYRRCLDLYYTRESALPGDPAHVARLIGMRENTADVAAVLNEFFVAEESGDWISLRCEAEISKAAAASERARANGRSGGRPPKEPSRNPVGSQQQPSSNPAESKSEAPNTNTITNTITKEEKVKKPSSPVLSVQTLVEDGLSEEVAHAWVAHRAAKRARLTGLAWDGFKVEASKAGWTLDEAVRKTIQRNWVSFEASWVAENKRQTERPKTFAEIDAENTAAQIHKMTGGLMGKPKADLNTIDMEAINGTRPLLD